MSRGTTTTTTPWAGQVVADSEGKKVGHLLQVFVDDQTVAPKWALVDTNLFTSRQRFVPLAGSGLDGSTLVLSCTKEMVNSAPQIANEGALSEDDEDLLIRHYFAGDRPFEAQRQHEIHM